MSDPRPLAERLDAALTDEVLDKANREFQAAYESAGDDGQEAHDAACLVMRAVLTAALLAALQPKGKLSDNPLTHELLDLITLMPDSQTQEILDYITDLRAIRARRDEPADGQHEKKFEIRCCECQRDVMAVSKRSRHPAEGPTPAPGDGLPWTCATCRFSNWDETICRSCGYVRFQSAPQDDTLARVGEFRAMLAQSGEDRVRASLILKTFDDLFSKE